MSKSSTKSSGSTTQNQVTSQTTTEAKDVAQQMAQLQGQNQTGFSTPTNLPYLQQVWNLGSDQVGNTNGNAANTTNLGINLAGRGAQAGSDAAISGINDALGIANGSTSGPNPMLDAILPSIYKGIQPAIDGSFAASGRYGSGANANAFASALTDTLGNLAYQNYGDSANRQLNAIDLLTGLIPTATGAGAGAIAAGQAPLTNFAQILAQLGAGGQTMGENGTAGQTIASNQSGTGSGTSNSNASGSGTSQNSSSNSGFNFGDITKMFSFGF